MFMKDCIQGDVQIARLHLMDIAEQLGSTTTTISTITTNTQLNLHENIHYWIKVNLGLIAHIIIL